MMQMHLLQELEQVAKRYRRLSVCRALTFWWLAIALLGGVALLLARQGIGSVPFGGLILTILVLPSIPFAIWRSAKCAHDYARFARQVESSHPELNSLLLTAVEMEPDLPDGRFGYLQERVIRKALQHSRWHKWQAAVSGGQLAMFQVACIGAFVFMAWAVGGLFETDGAWPGAGYSALLGGQSTVKREVLVTPGDAEIEAGTTLVVTAEFPGKVPDEAALIRKSGSGGEEILPMSLSLSDPVFGGRITETNADFSYVVDYGDAATRPYNVTVFHYPRLLQADADLVFPGYTGFDDKHIDDVRRLTAVEGTRITLQFRLNKSVAQAKLMPKAGDPLTLEVAADDARQFSVSLVLERSEKYALELLDAQGRENKQPPTFALTMTKNSQPDIKMVFPARDMRVSPIEELDLQARVQDDYGLLGYGVNFNLAGQPENSVNLGDPHDGNKPLDLSHIIDFEGLDARPDQVVAYYFWARDVAADGNPRETFSDMYFAEVRHFEEIFRQGNQPPQGDEQQQQQDQQQQQGEGQNAQQALQSAENQKQIINATWRVIRRETGASPTGEFADDVEELAKAQAQVLDEVKQLEGNLSDGQSLETIEAVTQHVEKALSDLEAAKDELAPEKLKTALPAEQAAYQGLLKLRAREFEVTRRNNQSQSRQQQQQQQQSASGNESRMQRQLDNLKLKEDENRYELQSRAEEAREQGQREVREALNRLRDLARRQKDLNQRLKELQSALEKAETEKEKEEIVKQLKRLRDQEQEILRDLDGLTDQMEKPENRESMEEARQDLEQTRDNVRQTMEALEDRQVSRAAASGTRAERELDEMKEEFRRRAADRFTEEMKEIRDEAVKLDEKEQALSEELEKMDSALSEQNRLTAPDRRQRAVEAFEKQGEDLKDLMETIQETIEEAETTEPLMTERLYDSVRRARQQRVEEALDVTRDMLRRGFVDQARQLESRAGEGIRQLRQDVEKAAESVLGNEEEALKRAEETLERLAEELENEVERSNQDPNQEGQRQEGQRQEGQRQEGQRQEGQRQEGQRQEGQRQEGQRQEGQRQEGQRQEGQRQEGQRQEGQRQEGQRQEGQRQEGQRQEGQRQNNGPITGDDFFRWSEELRDVEEMLEDSDMRAETARIRDRARGIRNEFRRNRTFKGPNWEKVRSSVLKPLNALRDRVKEALLRRDAKSTQVPLDRDPVPSRYEEQVRKYYEKLGSGK